MKLLLFTRIVVRATPDGMSEEMDNGTYLDYKLRTPGDRYEVFTADAIKEFSKKQVCECVCVSGLFDWFSLQ